MKTSSSLLSGLLAALLLSACAAPGPRAPATEPEFATDTDPVSALLDAGDVLAAAALLESEAAQDANPESRQNSRFRAARLYAEGGDDSGLLRLISALESEISSDNQRWHLRVLQAQWHLLRREPLLALSRTQAARPAFLDAETALYTAITKAQALIQLQDGVAALQALVDGGRGTTPELEEERLAAIAGILQNRDLFWLPHPDTRGSRMQGWLALGEITRRMWNSEAELDTALDAWRSGHLSHPGNSLLSVLRDDAASVARSAPRRVALLLPLSGPLAAVGQAIRDGFVAAYLDGRENRLQVQVFDTHSQTASAAFDSAVAGGADVIVGPLKKEAVAEVLAQNAFGLQQLALNTSPQTGLNRPWLLSLALPPEDDATAVARLALQQGHTRLVALRGTEGWAERSTAAFAQTLQENTGQLVDEVAFESRSDSYPEAIKTLMQLERSQDRAARIQHALGTPILYDLERRQDAEALFLAASLDDARQIRPQIRFFQGSDLPIYASGRLFDGDRERTERDLNGVYFCSSPWLLGSTEGWQSKRESFKQFDAPADQRWARFHAVGFDAYQLSTRVRGGGWPQGLSMAGASGELQIRGEHVDRRLPCAVYREGRPVVVATP